MFEEKSRPELPKETGIEQENFKDLVQRKQKNYKTGIQKENYKSGIQQGNFKDLVKKKSTKPEEKGIEQENQKYLVVKNDERAEDRIPYPVPISLISKEKNREEKHPLSFCSGPRIDVATRWSLKH